MAVPLPRPGSRFAALTLQQLAGQQRHVGQRDHAQAPQLCLKGHAHACKAQPLVPVLAACAAGCSGGSTGRCMRLGINGQAPPLLRFHPGQPGRRLLRGGGGQLFARPLCRAALPSKLVLHRVVQLKGEHELQECWQAGKRLRRSRLQRQRRRAARQLVAVVCSERSSQAARVERRIALRYRGRDRGPWG